MPNEITPKYLEVAKAMVAQAVRDARSNSSQNLIARSWLVSDEGQFYIETVGGDAAAIRKMVKELDDREQSTTRKVDMNNLIRGLDDQGRPALTPQQEKRVRELLDEFGGPEEKWRDYVHMVAGWETEDAQFNHETGDMNDRIRAAANQKTGARLTQWISVRGQQDKTKGQE